MRLTMLLSVVAFSAVAQDAAPADVIKSRQAVMKAMGAHMKALGLIANKKVNLAGHAEVHARALVDLAKLSKDLFPKGTGSSNGSLTEAKDVIWSDEKKFAQAGDDMAAAADKLAKAATQGDLKAAFDQANDSCSSCHKAFRANR